MIRLGMFKIKTSVRAPKLLNFVARHLASAPQNSCKKSPCPMVILRLS